MTQRRPWRRDLIARLILEAIVEDSETERDRICAHVRNRFCPIDTPVEDDELDEAAEHLLSMLREEQGKDVTCPISSTA